MARLVSGTLAALVALTLAACGESTASTQQASGASGGQSVDTAGVTLRLGDQERRLQTLMQAAGQLESPKYKINWGEFSSGPPMMQALSGRALDLGAVGDTPPIFAASAGGSGADIRMVAASYPGGDKDEILVPSGSGIKDVSQLKGKKVAVTQGSSAHLTLLLALQKAGLQWSDIQVSYLQPPAAQSAFATHQVDAWVVWYPFIAAAHSAGGKTLEDGTHLDPGHSFLVSNTASLQDRAKVAALRDFVHRVALAEKWAHSHLSEWSKLYAQISGLTLDQATATEKAALTQYVPIDASVKQAEQKAADAFATAGLMPKVDLSKNFDTRFNPDIA